MELTLTAEWQKHIPDYDGGQPQSWNVAILINNYTIAIAHDVHTGSIEGTRTDDKLEVHAAQLLTKIFNQH